MKKILLLLLALSLPPVLLAQCNAGSVVVAANKIVKGSCVVNGDLTVLNGARLEIDLSQATADTFKVVGNIVLKGSASVWVHGQANTKNDVFMVSNKSNNQFSITLFDSSVLRLENIEFKTQEVNKPNPSSVYMNLNVNKKASLLINACNLQTQTAWILCNLHNQAKIVARNSIYLPTELYVQDSSRAEIRGADTNLGVWMDLQSTQGSLNLPVDQTRPFNWKVGKGTGTLNAPWYLEIDTAQVGLGVQVQHSTQVTVNGTGKPSTGELTVSMIYANATDTIKNLLPGLQNGTVTNGANGFLKMQNVNLGPIAWQIYATVNENLFIKNSTINEIGIAGPSKITIDNCVLQLAVLASIGVGGSTMTINNSRIWNQEITAANKSKIILNNCQITGSNFHTSDTQSSIVVNGGCFFQNPSDCSFANAINIATGLPYCNPYVPAGYPQNQTPATVTFNNVSLSCVTGVETKISGEDVSFYPNPATEVLYTSIPSHKISKVVIYNLVGEPQLEFTSFPVAISDLPQGVFIIQAQTVQGVVLKRFVKI